jgi:hypothetical protein
MLWPFGCSLVDQAARRHDVTAPTDSGKPGKPDAAAAPTPVPPRGGKKKPNRPTAARPAAGRPAPKAAAARASGARPATKGPTNRRQAEWQARRRRNIILSAVAVAVVVIVVAVFVVIKATDNSSTTASSKGVTGTGPSANLTLAQAGVSELPASASKVLTVPIAALAAASKGVTIPGLSGGSTISKQPPLTANGKPEVLYIGAGFCPYCAAERWAIVAALAKFGTFTNLGSAASSGTDTNAYTPTFSFYRSTYTSPYITFTGVETTTQVQTQRLESPTAAQDKLWKALDSGQTIPFIDFGNKYRISGATYDSSSMSNTSFASVAAQVGNNTTTVGKGIDQAAGAMVKGICQMTGNQPGSVCSAIGS